MSKSGPKSQNGSGKIEIEYAYRCDTCGRGFLTKEAHNGHSCSTEGVSV